jgi:hypothetical protein
MIPRRALLALPCLAATPALAITTHIALRPGAPPFAVQARIAPHGEAREALAISFAGPGAPEGRVLLPSWYGRARVLNALPIASREVLVAAFEGNAGTGVYQELMAVIGCDDAGRLRILAIETLSFRDNQVSTAWRRTSGQWEVGPRRDALILRMRSTARLPTRPPGPRPGPERTERWSTRLAWNADGPLRPAAEAPARPGAVQRRVDAARARILALLDAPVTDATRIDFDATGIFAVGDAVSAD